MKVALISLTTLERNLVTKQIAERLFLALDLALYIQTCFLSYGCDNFLRIYSRGERYPSALWG